MRKLWLLCLLVLCGISSLRAQNTVILQDSIVGNVTLTNDQVYLIRGFVYVVNGATLTIQPGTLLFGEKATKGTLIVEPGGKLFAAGTATQPIVFTSSQPAGQRDRGDWGGIVLCGRAPINQNNTSNGGNIAGGDAQIEGGPRTHYGGTDEHDNSGTLSYVRIEFPGIALSPNNEINGLTLGGVGDGTQLNHIQVSYSGDDNFEWFGGSVCAKYLIGYRGLDDEWDTDFGWHGKLQFCVSMRDPAVADVSGSNGFESDNDASGHFWNPRTSAVISNLTVIGPMADTSLASAINPLFKRGAHLRRATQESIYNTIVMGWPDGILFDGDAVANAAKNDTLQLRNNIWAGLRTGHEFLTAALSSGTVFDPKAWFNTAAFGNQTFPLTSQVKLADAFNLVSPDWKPLPSSPAIGAASFTNSRLQDPFFSQVTYVGAFDPNAQRWDAGWANYDPVNTAYVATVVASASTIQFPNTAVGSTYDSTIIILRNTGNGPASIHNWFLTDTSNFRVVGGYAPFSIPVGGTKQITIRFLPTDTTQRTQGLNFVFDNGLPQVSVVLKGKGTVSAPALSIYPSATSYNFAYVPVGKSASNNFIITNSGTAPLTITSATLAGADASAFSISGTPAQTIAAGKTGIITVTFAPSTVGDKAASLRINHNAGAGSSVIALTGKGINIPTTDVLQDSIVGNQTLTNDRVWLLRGFVYVVNGAVLNIEPGTVIMGDKATKGTLIVEPGGQLFANGTEQHPIIFTSQEPAGKRDRGDWGGVVLCGRAPINQNNADNGGTKAGGDAQIEGGPRTHYGGTDEHDNSGILRYVRIEFPGVALSPNNEINGLTMGGVGDATQIDHIQVSYSGDDSYEWFGGSVNAKNLIALRGLDDDWDTDFGWHGKLQFGVSLRDPNVADVSGSNGFESDNDASGHYWNPRTAAHFSNMTVVGPMSDTSKLSTINPLFKRGAHLRRSTHESIYNSIVMGWPVGVLVDGDGAANGAKNDTLQIRNSIWAGLRPGNDFITTGLSASTTFDAKQWFMTPGYGNMAITQPADVKLTNPFDLTHPDFRPMTGSPAATGANFQNSRLQDPFFAAVNYIGAFEPGAARWDSGWTNYDPQSSDYGVKRQLSRTSIAFGQVMVGHTAYDSITITNTGLVPLTITRVALSDSSAIQLVANPGSFTVAQGESRTIHLSFNPTATHSYGSTLRMTLRDETSLDVQVTGEGIALGVDGQERRAAIQLRNVPNPFTRTTEITYNVPSAGDVAVEVYDVTGVKVATLAHTHQGEGMHSVTFDASSLSKGVYYCRLQMGDIMSVIPVVVVK